MVSICMRFVIMLVDVALQSCSHNINLQLQDNEANLGIKIMFAHGNLSPLAFHRPSWSTVATWRSSGNTFTKYHSAEPLQCYSKFRALSGWLLINSEHHCFTTLTAYNGLSRGGMGGNGANIYIIGKVTASSRQWTRSSPSPKLTSTFYLKTFRNTIEHWFLSMCHCYPSFCRFLFQLNPTLVVESCLD